MVLSCKGRGFCQSCLGRRLAQDGVLLGRLTRIVMEPVLAFYAARAAKQGWRGAKSRAVTGHLAASAVSNQAPPAGPQWLTGLAPLQLHALPYDKPRSRRSMGMLSTRDAGRRPGRHGTGLA